MNSSERQSLTHWQAFFSYGFRPFFLFACSYAAIAMAAWIAWIGIYALDAEVSSITIAMPPHIWHAHEMIYGYAMAVIAGFFLTAVPSWTDTRPVQGTALQVLVSIWILGRIAIWSSAFLPVWLVALLDLAFIPALSSLLITAFSKRWSKRNLIFLPILTLLFAGNVLVHAEQIGWLEDTIQLGHQLALDSILLLIIIIGGRIIPAFTTNTLRNSGRASDKDSLPVSHTPVEALSIGSMAALLIANAFDAPSDWIGGIALVAAAIHTVRLSGWSGHKTLRWPIMWILHLGYAWLILGLVLIGAAAFSNSISHITALHALTVGAVGSVTVGVLTRAGLGHTGRTITASPMIVASYIMISLAAALRILTPLVFAIYYDQAMLLSGFIWIGAFTLLTWTFYPILTSPRPGQA